MLLLKAQIFSTKSNQNQTYYDGGRNKSNTFDIMEYEKKIRRQTKL